MSLLNQNDFDWLCRGTISFLVFRPTTRRSTKGKTMAKSQKKSNREVRKPKAEKAKTNAANPSQKSGVVPGLENMKR
jgi:hypothetical protein